MLETLFRSKVMVQLLAYFMKNPDKDVYLREVGREIDEPASAVQRELQKLEAFGLVVTRRRGNHKYFKFKQDAPILPELKGLFLKTEGASGYLKETIAKVPGIQLAFAYGPFAEQPNIIVSDIHLGIIGTPDKNVLAATIENIQQTLGRKVTYMLYAPDEFARLIEGKDPIMNAVLSGEKLILVANVSDKQTGVYP